MPQEFQILRCCECEKFQVHHVKKAKKWQCKVCGLKQSMTRAFFIGSAPDCRVNVQKLNFQAGEKEMKRKLGESGSSGDDENPSLEKDNEDFAYSTENEVGEDDWIDKNDGMDENDWIDENDWVDENDWIDEINGYSSELAESVCNRNSQSDFEDDLPRKKQRCESYPKFETVKEYNHFNCSKEEVEDQGELLFSSILKCMQDGNSSKPIDSVNNISSAEASKIESKHERGSFEDREEKPLPEIAKPGSNSVLKPTHGFQLILNEAKKQRTDLNYDLDW